MVWTYIHVLQSRATKVEVFPGEDDAAWEPPLVDVERGAYIALYDGGVTLHNRTGSISPRVPGKKEFGYDDE